LEHIRGIHVAICAVELPTNSPDCRHGLTSYVTLIWTILTKSESVNLSMTAVRTAEVVWEKDLLTGGGSVRIRSGALPEFPVTWASRTEAPGGKTSPEELLAAAHASCYAMALSAALARRRMPPERLNVTAQCTFDKVGDDFKVTTMELTVQGKVPGLERSAFEEVAQAAEKSCPISNAIRNNVEIRLTAKLD
jgi:osmotically inducible protein OsmC